MTRQTALKQAIAIIKKAKIPDSERNEIIKGLTLCIDELPYAKWSKAAIFDACDQFIEDHNRRPTLNDFNTRYLPSHPTVKLRFGMTLKEFRDTYYPPDKAYEEERINALIANFKSDVEKKGIYGRREYDMARDKSLPTSTTLIKLVGVKTWGELLVYAGMSKKRKAHPREKTILSSSFALKIFSLNTDNRQA